MPGLSVYRQFDGPIVHGEVHCGDAVHFLQSLPAESAAVVFLDPPFNLGKDYGEQDLHDDRLPEEEYQKLLDDVIREAIRVLAPGGALYVYHLPLWGIRIAGQLDKQLEFRHWIAVSMKNGFARGSRLYPAHYALLYFTKGAPLAFNRPKILPQTCRHCGKVIKDYGGYKSIIDEKGINLSDVWDDLSPVRHAKAKTRDQNQLPLTLTDRVLAISGSPGKLFVDPFAGSGSPIVSAVNVGMVFQACDIVEDNCAVICRRLQEVKVSPTAEDNYGCDC